MDCSSSVWHAQCIDVCDDVMDKIGRPRGLIRYSSQASASGERSRILRPRVVIYGFVVAGIVALLATLLAKEAPLDVTLLRNLGRPFVINDAGMVENTMRVKLTNRTNKPVRVQFSIAGRADVQIIPTEPVISLLPLQSWTEPVLIVAPKKAFTFGTAEVTVRVTDEDHAQIDRSCRLLGPMTDGGTDDHE